MTAPADIDVRRLRLRRGDVLVVKSATQLTVQDGEAVETAILQVLGKAGQRDVPVLVVGPDFDVALVEGRRLLG